ncbi:MAG: hypothetical protein ACXWAY_00865 [Acidimicrobiia bacterium]
MLRDQALLRSVNLVHEHPHSHGRMLHVHEHPAGHHERVSEAI